MTKLITPLMIALIGICACQSPKPTLTKPGENALDSASRDLSVNEQSTPGSGTQISQITDAENVVDAAQIGGQAPVAVLTVEQLRTYVDRCLPNSPQPAPETLDCSELGLRVKRVLNTEDKITEALATLDRLGRADGADEISRSLKEGRIEGSLSAQAIAGGILEGLPQEEPEDPDEKLRELLDATAAIQAGAIPPPQ